LKSSIKMATGFLSVSIVIYKISKYNVKGWKRTQVTTNLGLWGLETIKTKDKKSCLKELARKIY